MKVKNIINVLENWAPPSLQESYDNSGLLTGNPEQEISKCLVALDCLESIVDEAITKGAEMIVAHHPIVFSGLKSLTGKNYIEKVIIKAIQNNIAIYAIHTNLDNVNTGVNLKIAERLNLEDLQVLEPKKGLLKKLVTYVPSSKAKSVLNALFKAGAGNVGNYSECSFKSVGEGTFKAEEGSNPFVGKQGEQHQEKETRLEVVLQSHIQNKVLRALIESHPYEEVAYDFYALENKNIDIGAGMVGDLKVPMQEIEFLKFVKTNLNTQCIRHTALLNKEIKKVAFCGGSGSFLLDKAIKAKADVFITGDFKYHQFFDAEEKLIIFDVGHFESEQFTIDLIADKLQEKFPTFAVLKTEIDTNPISYY